MPKVRRMLWAASQADLGRTVPSTAKRSLRQAPRSRADAHYHWAQQTCSDGIHNINLPQRLTVSFAIDLCQRPLDLPVRAGNMEARDDVAAGAPVSTALAAGVRRAGPVAGQV